MAESSGSFSATLRREPVATVGGQGFSGSFSSGVYQSSFWTAVDSDSNKGLVYR